MTTDMFRLTSRTLDVAGEPPPVLVEVDGEVDVTSAQAFAEAVTEAAGRSPLVLDLTSLKYVDSAGFAALDGLLSRRRTVIVLAPQSPARGAATLIGLPCHDTVEAALAALQA